MGTINKAIAALISNVVILLGVFGYAVEATPEVIAAVSTVVTTLVVYIVPNLK